ncbi:MAG: HAD hydrolase-like protein [Muribaculaceae bacterium]|nr:HAD hydrolase-like protein [Muribaculaceae bacterium]
MDSTDNQHTTIIHNALRHWSERTGRPSLDIRCACIDMDGTLYDSMRNHTAAWHRLMTGQGISCTPDEFYLYEGCTGADTIRRLWPRNFAETPDDELIRRLYALKSRYFNELPPVALMPGAQAMVSELTRAGIATILVTGSGQTSVLDKLDRDYPGAFPEGRRITARNVTHGKPDPEPYLKGMQLASALPAETIVIENAPIGALAGVRSGAFTVAVRTGPIPRDEFEKVDADLIVDSMPEFARLLPDLISLSKKY